MARGVCTSKIDRFETGARLGVAPEIFSTKEKCIYQTFDVEPQKSWLPLLASTRCFTAIERLSQHEEESKQLRLSFGTYFLLRYYRRLYEPRHERESFFF